MTAPTNMLSIAILLLVILTQIQAATYCVETDECVGQTITDWAYCYGYRGCYLATIQGPGAHCYGMRACYGAAITTTSSSIYCSGYYSCQNADEISSAGSLYCEGLYSCASNDNMVASSDSYCDGDGSCRSATITAQMSWCNGNYACYYANITTTDYDILCDGDFGCASATLNAADDVECYGKYGCYSADITAGDTVYLYGYYAASRSDLITAKSVEIRGYYGAAYSTLDSKDKSEMNVYCYVPDGGRGADFICRAGSTCYLYCEYDCCNYLDYVCVDGATCTLDCEDSCPTVSSSTASGAGLDILDQLTQKKNRYEDPVYIALQNEIERDLKRYNDKINEFEPEAMEPRDNKPNDYIFYYAASYVVVAVISASMIYCYYNMKCCKNNRCKQVEVFN